MQMLDRIVESGDRRVTVKPKTELFFVAKSGILVPWIILEMMGQAAELLWRSKGMGGRGYLVKVQNFINFPSALTVPGEAFLIVAEGLHTAMNLCRSDVRFFFGTDSNITVTLTHFFEEHIKE
jgi:hypothetical protein